MNIDKTVTFAVDDKTVAVADLPAGLRKQFEVLDAFRQELADITVRYEMVNLAINVKTMQLQEIIRQLTAPKAEPKTETEQPAAEAKGSDE